MTVANTPNPNPGDETAWLELLFARWDPAQIAGTSSVGVETFLKQFSDLPAKVADDFRRLAEADGKLPGKFPSPATVQDDKVPKQIGRYEVLRELGKGGMGRVYEARDPELGRLVAVKIILGNVVAGERWDRFRAEAETLARLNHPHIVPIFDTGADGDRRFFVMEWAGRGALSSHAGRANPPREVVTLLILLARAIAAAHKAGVLHRDLKPHNVLLCDPADEPALNSAWGWPKVADFGLAKEIDVPHDRTAPGVPFGSPAYMAPEQVRGDLDAHGFPTDVYGLGAIMFQMLAGRPPFVGTLPELYHQILTKTAEPPSTFNTAVSPALDAICLKCLAKDPRDRYARAEELSGALLRWLQEPDEGAGRTEFRVLVAAATAVSMESRERMGESVYQQTVRRIDRFFLDHLKGVKGARILPESAGGVLASFPSATEAVKTALVLRTAARSAVWGVEHIGLRIAIHAGDVTELPGPTPDTVRPSGLAVEAVLALRTLALPNQVLLTKAVFDESRSAIRESSGTLAWRSYGRYIFGLPAPLDVNEVGYEGQAPLVIPPDTSTARRSVTPAEEETGVWRPSVGQTLPDRDNWRLTEKVGVGGFGEVWRAMHVRTRDRRVFKFCFDADKLAGLRKEVAFLQVLRSELADRTDIARIHDWKLKGEPPFFLEIEDVPGGSLVDWANVRPNGLAGVPLEERLELVARTADALGAAHNIGVIHCDVKPSNILVRPASSGGTPGVVLADFGISRITDPDLFRKHAVTVARTVTLFRESSGSGTEMYRAPELHTGLQTPTVRSDVYALGVVLYQMAVGDVLRPLAPGWERDVADDLVRADIAACVDGKPEHRPASAGEVARRLRDLPARRKAAFDEQRRLLRRRTRRRWTVGSAALLALGYGLAIPFLLWKESSERSNAVDARQLAEVKGQIAEHARAKEHQARENAEKDREKAEHASAELVKERDHATGLAKQIQDTNDKLKKERDHATGLAKQLRDANDRIEETTLTFALLSNSDAAFRQGEFTEAYRQLRLVPKRIRRWEWNYRYKHFDQADMVLYGHCNTIWSVAWSPSGNLLASASSDTTMRIWNAVTGANRDFVVKDAVLGSVAWRPDGKQLATAGEGGAIYRWDMVTGHELKKLPGNPDWTLALAWSPDGARLASAGEDGSIRIWNLNTETDYSLTGQVELKNYGTIGLTWSPDGRRLAAAMNKTVFVWELSEPALAVSRPPLPLLKIPFPTAVNGVDWSPDGKRLATGDAFGSIKIWDAATGNLAREHKNLAKEVSFVAWSPDGMRLAASCADSTVVVLPDWNGETRSRHYGHTSSPTCVCWSPDGRRLASSSRDRTVRVWDAVEDRHNVLELKINNEMLDNPSPIHAAWSSDNTRLAVVFADKNIRIWNSRIGDYIRIAPPPVPDKVATDTLVLDSVSWSADGSLLATPVENTVRIYDPTTGDTVRVLSASETVKLAAWCPHGKRVAVCTASGLIEVLDAATGKSLRVFGRSWWNRVGETPITCLVWSPDGTRVTAGGDSPTVRVWDAATGEVVQQFVGHRLRVPNLAWSADGTRLATCSDDLTVKIWDTATAATIRTLTISSLSNVAWSPDGTRFVLTGRGSIWLLDADTGQIVLTLDNPNLIREIAGVAWSPNGRKFASVHTNSIRVWDAELDCEVLEPKDDDAGWVNQIAWKPNDDTFLAAALSNKAVRIWNRKTGEFRDLKKIEGYSDGHTEAVLCVAWSPDGTRLASGGNDSTVRVWDVATGKSILYSGHEKAVKRLAWKPEGDQLASIEDRGVRLIWDAASGKQLNDVGNPPWATKYIPAISPDGQRIAAAVGNAIRIVPVTPAPDVLGFRQAKAKFEPQWAALQMYFAVKSNNHFATVFHAASLAEWNPVNRATWDRLLESSNKLGSHQRALKACDTILSGDPGLAPIYRQRSIVRLRNADSMVGAVLLGGLHTALPVSGHASLPLDTTGAWDDLLTAALLAPSRTNLWLEYADEASKRFEYDWAWRWQPNNLWHGHHLAWYQYAKGHPDQCRATTALLLDRYWSLDILAVGLAPSPLARGLAQSNVDTEVLQRRKVALDYVVYTAALFSDCAGLDVRELLDLAENVFASASATWAQLDDLGALYYRAGLYDKAITYLERAGELEKNMKMEDRTWQIHFLAMAYQRAGRPDLARTWYARSVKPKAPKTWQQNLVWDQLHREAKDVLGTVEP